MKNKNYLIVIFVNLFFLAATIITDILYITKGNAYVFKTIASATFVVFALSNLFLIYKLKVVSNKKFVISLLLGQIFAMIGDILLIDYFILGAISFAIGHIFYFVSYCFIKRLKWIDLAFIFATIIISIIVIFASRIEFGKYLPLVIVYALVISCMLGKSATLFLENYKVALIIFIGSLLFYVSDVFLMFAEFGAWSRTLSILCLAFYYPAEFLLASSISAVNLIDKKEKIND